RASSSRRRSSGSSTSILARQTGPYVVENPSRGAPPELVLAITGRTRPLVECSRIADARKRSLQLALARRDERVGSPIALDVEAISREEVTPVLDEPVSEGMHATRLADECPQMVSVPAGVRVSLSLHGRRPLGRSFRVVIDPLSNALLPGQREVVQKCSAVERLRKPLRVVQRFPDGGGEPGESRVMPGEVHATEWNRRIEEYVHERRWRGVVHPITKELRFGVGEFQAQ